MLIVAFGISGVTHFAAPQVFYPLIPPMLGYSRGWTYASGAAELVCAAGLASRETWAPKTTAITLAAVWIGNWWLAIRAGQSATTHPAVKTALWLRVPLQLPMIRAALNSPVRG